MANSGQEYFQIALILSVAWGAGKGTVGHCPAFFYSCVTLSPATAVKKSAIAQMSMFSSACILETQSYMEL